MPATFTVRLDEATLAALDRLVEQTERSRSWLVTKVIEDYVALNSWQIGKIEAGIAAADRACGRSCQGPNRFALSPKTPPAPP